MCSVQANEEWRKLHSGLDTRDLYIGGTCALLHTLNFDNYVKGEQTENYVSLLFIVNASGTHKKQLTVVGKESVDNDVRSLPVNYSYCDSSQLNLTTMFTYISKWDNQLKEEGKYVTLTLSIPDDIVERMHFSNIRIISSINMEFVTKSIEKIIENFKYNFRRLQITRKMVYDNDCQMKISDYIYIISAAWHSVPCHYIECLFNLPEVGSNINNMKDEHSLSQWCKTYNVPINVELYSDMLDKYIHCDNQLQALNFEQDNEVQEISADELENLNSSHMSVEAYQAIKRLICYLQGKSVGGSVIKCAKHLENHLEYGVLSGIHNIVADANN